MSVGLSKKVMKFVLALHSIARWMKIIPLPATYTEWYSATNVRNNGGGIGASMAKKAIYLWPDSYIAFS